MTPLVSIITPTYNSQSFITDTIHSILDQTYSNWELMIVDDASKDDTLAVVNAFTTDPRIKIFSLKENKGAAVARNRGISEAKGDYITFLDADDLWKPHKLATQLDFMQKNAVQVSFSSYELIDEQGRPMHKKVKALPELTYKKLMKSNYVGNLTGMYDAGSLGKIYSPVLRKRQDWGLWLACIKKAGLGYGIAESLALYRVRKGSISSNKLEMLKYNYAFYRKALNFGTLKSLRMLCVFLWEHFFVKSRQIVSTEQL